MHCALALLIRDGTQPKTLGSCSDCLMIRVRFCSASEYLNVFGSSSVNTGFGFFTDGIGKMFP